MINIAHRGLSAKAPENTLYSFDYAIALGMFHLEFDVQLTSDNLPVVIHDETVERTTDSNGLVNSFNFEEITSLIALNKFKNMDSIDPTLLCIPSLQDVLIRYLGQAHYYIELKSSESHLPGIVAEVLEECDALKYSSLSPQLAPGLTIISFSLEQVMRSQMLLPKVRHGWLRYDFNRIDIDLVVKNNLHGIYPYVQFIQKDLVQYAIERDVGVGVWGIEKESEYRDLLGMGVHGATVNWLP